MVERSPTEEELRDIPANARLAQVLFVQDAGGVQPPRIVVHEVDCEEPKRDGYLLRAQVLHYGAREIAELMRGNQVSFGLKMNDVISPIRVLGCQVLGGAMEIVRFPKGAGFAALKEVCPQGVVIRTGMCLVESKDRLIAAMVDSASAEIEAHLKPLEGRLQQLRQLSAGLHKEASPAVTAPAQSTGGPEWRYGANKGSVYMYPEEGGVGAGYQWVATTNPEMVGLPENQEAMESHAERLAACANACRGMDDPVAEVSALRQAAPALQRVNGDEYERGGPSGR